ncbi:MAG: S1/P1 nuclease [Bryobacterales bacterium]|nr:S1/P1 nuclease [Bryobacterales bacterium]
MSPKLVCAALVLAVGLPAWGWNAVGHRAVAGLAYDNLSKKARSRVDDLIKRHPDYKQLIKGAPADGKQRARYAFMKAAVWPDTIKGDQRFYDDARRGATATPTVAGFPNMKQHRNWHYINVAFSTDGTRTPENSPAPNALTELKRMRHSVAGIPSDKPTEDDAVYVLPWLLHLVGDVHQPLHCATRYRKVQKDAQGRPVSDLGGNTVNVVGAYNLHAFWDDALGIVDSDAYVNQLIKVMAKQPKDAKPRTDPQTWIDEGFLVAKDAVYSFGNEGGTKDNPVQLDGSYVARSRDVARRRAALGGRRLAAVLNEALK